MTKEKRYEESGGEGGLGDGYALMLVNDDINTFDHVIESLVEICDHYPEQAEQCAYITHHKGSCDIKRGSRSELYKMRRRLSDKRLTVDVIRIV